MWSKKIIGSREDIFKMILYLFILKKRLQQEKTIFRYTNWTSILFAIRKNFQ